MQTSKRKNDRFVVNNYEAILSNIESDVIFHSLFFLSIEYHMLWFKFRIINNSFQVDIRIASIAGKIHAIICFVEAPTSHIVLYDNENGRITGPESLEIHDIITKSIGASIIDIKLDNMSEINENKVYNNSMNDVVKKLYNSNVSLVHMFFLRRKEFI